jgi:acyl carrier protein
MMSWLRRRNVSDADTIKGRVKDYIVREFLTGEDPDSLTDSTPLISGGILDSISTIKLVTFLEQSFNIQVEAHEMSADYLDDLSRITAMVLERSAAR